jgi:hypothetical protein
LAQFSIVYFYAGVAKLNGDWLAGEPMRSWLVARYRFRIISQWVNEEFLVYAFAYGGLLLDLLIAPALLWRRSRPFAFVVAIIFHLLNAKLFSIGIFPWFMIAATALYFPPDWPRRLFARVRGIVLEPARRLSRARPLTNESATITHRQRLIAGLLGAYIAAQLLVPMRHLLYPGNVSWTEEGHDFSWHMKLRDKEAEGWFLTREVGRKEWEIIQPSDYLKPWQASQMLARPEMVAEFSRYLAVMLRPPDVPPIEVRAYVRASLNGRKHQLLIDPNVNLAEQAPSLWPASWIVPLIEPLKAIDVRTASHPSSFAE